jgi:hypothetical protein
MKVISFGLATAVALALFTAFGSVGLATRTSVTANIVSMHAVLPDGALMDLRTNVVSAAHFDNRSTL